jgi:hypothetical protein
MSFQWKSILDYIPVKKRFIMVSRILLSFFQRGVWGRAGGVRLTAREIFLLDQPAGYG